ncbi:MAG: uroporphyrinogen-III C-methyltransferase [Candidatus Omnitrophica bacterium]|nr:uroporphyrinogen-III C-methyltransferase [Candidatus Omnitrophota bacterium]MBU4479282.1 uroporphyrinogen-III C-methyltransferase [Candidatus Omnitrophota bacterium]MCG2703263.1 uroporphyrinogen-III C-methyltransferase [Candidatus Omnitrophota bacterium]
MIKKQKGKVVLIGAGPGNEQLITAAGLGIIRAADVIVYDNLAGTSVLERRKLSAKLIFAGKIPGEKAMPQQQINALLIRCARRGALVARLKGGDPFLFGRGAEEALALQKARIDFAVIPGISAAFAAAAYAGIPLTHRGISSQVTFITGHEDPQKKKSDIDWQATARLKGTLVIYMGMANLHKITQRLISYGMRRNTPACIIQWASLPYQKIAVAALENIARQAKSRAVTHPAVVIIGDVVALHERIRRCAEKPLFAKKVLITRPLALAGEFREKLEAEGAQAVVYPLIETVAEEKISGGVVLKKIKTCDWVIFTSRNAVEICFEVLAKKNKDARFFGAIKVAALGEETKKALFAKGINADLVPEQFYMESLIEEFAKVDIRGKRIFIPHSRQARPLLCAELTRLGAVAEELFIYKVKRPAQAKKSVLRRILAEQKMDVVTFTSSSCVHQFMKLMGKEKGLLARQVFAVIGPVTANTLRDYGYKGHIMADVYTVEGLVRAIKEYYSKEK